MDICHLMSSCKVWKAREMDCITSETQDSTMDDISNGISNIQCKDEIHGKPGDLEKEQNGMNKAGNRSRIPRPEISFSGFKQNSNASKRTPSGGKIKNSQKNSNKKGKFKSKSCAEVREKTSANCTYPRSESVESYSFGSKQGDSLDNGTWSAKDNSWTFKYTETDNCPLHGATESSVHTLGTGSDPGPSTSSSYTSNPPVLVSGVMSEENSTGSKGQIAKTKKRKFNSYISLAEIQKGLKKGEVLEGVLRINQRNFEDSYISSPQEDQTDIYIGGMHDRNRALHGDVVAVTLKSPELWKINKEAIKTYESLHGLLQFPNDQVKPSIKLPQNNFNTNNSVKPPEYFPSSNSSVSSRKANGNLNDEALELNESNRSSNLENDQCGRNNFSQGENITSNRTSSTFANSLDHFDDIFTQPHSVEILGLENLQQDINQFKQAHNQENKRKPNDKMEINDWKTFKCGSGDAPTNNTSTLVVSPEEILMDSEGQFIGSASDVICDEEQITLNPKTVVPPDQLSECDDSIDDAASVGSFNQYAENREFFYSQLNAFNSNNQPDPELDIDLLNLNSFMENNVEKNEIHAESEILTKNQHAPETSTKNKKRRKRRGKKKLNEDEDKVDESSSSSKTVPENNCSNKNDEMSEKVTKNKKCNRRKHKNKCKDEITNVNNDFDRVKDKVNSLNIPNLGEVKSDQEYTIEQLLRHSAANKFVQKTAEVVGIIATKHPRIAAGRIRLQQNRDKNFALFSPNDSRVPRIMVPMCQCPPDFLTRPKDYEKSLFVARIVEWREESTFAHGNIYQELGKSGDVKAETEAILIDNSVDYSDFPDLVIKSLPINFPWTIPEAEIKKRKDFRNECVFTIDPSTARDLDDALSIKSIGDGLYKISVHIADVSFFVPEDSPVDKVAKERATSVYLIQRVIPMLPRVLCEQLCSLNPSEDKLTFSVEWIMSEEGKIMHEWFGKGIIKSCVKLSYNHAQDMIDTANDKLKNLEVPPVTGNYSMEDVAMSVKNLNKIAKKLRSQRFESGALSINQIKTYFDLDSETGMPYSYGTYQHTESHGLIEEFMLLANMSVAHFLYKQYPESAFLRCHPPPQKPIMDKTADMCSAFGICIDCESSKTMQSSLSLYSGDGTDSKARYAALLNLFAKPMNCAEYFCCGNVEDTTRYHHYALNVPLYTHFTSPIRRYADVIVHRQLAAALNIEHKLKISRKSMKIQATICNEKKYNAKKASEMSAELFLGLFVQECGPLKERAIVIGVMDRSFDVLLLSFGSVKRVYCDKISLKSYSFKKTLGVSELTLIWQHVESSNDKCMDENLIDTQVITLFCLVDVSLIKGKEDYTYSATLQRPALNKNK